LVNLLGFVPELVIKNVMTQTCDAGKKIRVFCPEGALSAELDITHCAPTTASGGFE
jgi:hypothetical protein